MNKKERNKQYYFRHRKEIIARSIERNRNNPESFRENRRRYYARLNGKGGEIIPRYRVTCAGCGQKKPEYKMDIYDVHTDRYFCNQRCKNKKDGIKRDKHGFITAITSDEALR